MGIAAITNYEQHFILLSHGYYKFCFDIPGGLEERLRKWFTTDGRTEDGGIGISKAHGEPSA